MLCLDIVFHCTCFSSIIDCKGHIQCSFTAIGRNSEDSTHLLHLTLSDLLRLQSNGGT